MQLGCRSLQKSNKYDRTCRSTYVFMRDQRWVFIDNNLDRSIGRSG